MAVRLRKAPRDRELLASAITLYHIMIEGGPAQAGPHMIERTLVGPLDATKAERSWGHRKTFGYVEDMAFLMRKAPRDRELLASAITLYRIMIEGGPAQAGQHMIERMLDELDLLPGFREGM